MGTKVMDPVKNNMRIFSRIEGNLYNKRLFFIYFFISQCFLIDSYLKQNIDIEMIPLQSS